MNHDGNLNQVGTEKRIWFDLYPIGLWGAIGIIVYFLLSEHRAHFIQFLPFLFLLACPLMHIFMHRDHSQQLGRLGK